MSRRVLVTFELEKEVELPERGTVTWWNLCDRVRAFEPQWDAPVREAAAGDEHALQEIETEMCGLLSGMFDIEGARPASDTFIVFVDGE